MIKADFSDFKRLAEDLKKQLGEEFVKDFLLQEGLDVLAKTMIETPVDTGMLRSSWRMGNIRDNMGGSNGFAFSPDEVYADGKNAYSIDIGNFQPYASYVELGHRIVGKGEELGWKTGKFMLTNSLTEAERDIQRRFDIAIKRAVDKIK